MTPYDTIVLVGFLVVAAVLCIYGVHRYWLIVSQWRHAARLEADPPGRFETLPPVTIQLPMYNERHVAARLIDAAANLDYPRDRLQIQVLDDSTDESVRIVADAVRTAADAGVDITHVRRADRTGYKAGALAAGCRAATGEFIAVFDADFVPGPSWLKDTIHEFTDQGVGMVQTRWTHLNRDASLLTQVQAICLDAHFAIEHAARSAAGRWFNFNGTAGIWRASCIADAGGWTHDTLTEDTDLSYRAQLKGWRFRFLPHVACPSETPPTIAAFMTQQHRWNKGLAQNALKLLPTIWTSRASFLTKLDATFHLTSPAPYVAILLLTLLATPALFASGSAHWGGDPMTAWTAGLVCLLLGTASASAFYVAGQVVLGRSGLATVLRLPVLMALGIGLSVTATRAVVEALIGSHSPFVRTPKFGDASDSPPDPALASKRRWIPPGVPETVLGVLMVVCCVWSLLTPDRMIGAPFLVLFSWGYLMLGLPRLWNEARAAWRTDGTPRTVSRPGH